MGQTIFLLVISGLCLGGYYLIRKNEKQKVEKEVVRETSKLNLLSIPDSKFELYGNIGSNHAMLSTNNELYILNNECTGYDKINYLDILDVKMDLHVTERNTRRIIAFTSTYDRKSQINKIELKIITGYKTYTIYYTPCANTPKGYYHGTLGDKINDTERFKLIIENEINKIKTNN